MKRMGNECLGSESFGDINNKQVAGFNLNLFPFHTATTHISPSKQALSERDRSVNTSVKKVCSGQSRKLSVLEKQKTHHSNRLLTACGGTIK